MIAKLTKLIALLAITLSHTFGQGFEGKITYKNSYKSKMANIPDQQFNSMMGTIQEYLIKGGDYKSLTNGTLLQWQLYINKDNKLYNKMSNSNALLWNDGASNTDEVLKAEINKNVVKVLGHNCDELILTCKSGIQKYYFSTKFGIDSKLYEKHKFGNWSEVISRTNSIPLKIILDNPQFTLECNAVEIQEMKLDSKLFELPLDSKLEKSPY